MKQLNWFGLLIVILFVGLILTYSNHFNNPFHFDDHHTIVDNKFITNLRYVPRYFVDASTTSSLPANQAYRPGLTLLNAIDYYLAGGLKPWVFHTSIFVSYIFLLILIYFVTKKILDISNFNNLNKYFALFTTAFYGFHTANAETINYIIARSDSFSTLMILLSLSLFIFFPNKRKYQLYLFPFIFGFLVKEPTIMLIAILILYLLLFEYTFIFDKILSSHNWKLFMKAIKTIFPLIIVGLLLVYISRKLTPPHWVGSTHDWKLYAITQPFVIVHYFWSYIFPNKLSVDTDWKLLNSILDIRFFMGMFFIIGLFLIIFKLIKIKELRPIAFGLCWFLLALLPTSSFIPLSEVLNDHRPFFPYIGLTFALANSIQYYFLVIKRSFLDRCRNRLVLIFIAFSIISIHAYGTHVRNNVWSSDLTLWGDAAKKSPKNGRALMNYGLAFMRMGKYEEALKLYEEALIYNPYYSYLYINIAICKNAMGKIDEVENNYKKAIQYASGYYGAFYYYGNWLYSQGKIQEAINSLKVALELNPVSIDVRYLLMQIYLDNQDYGPLQQLAENTLKIFPDDHKTISFLEASKGKKTKLEIAKEIVEKDPTPENYLNLSLEYYNVGLFHECINACNEALKLKPDYALAYNNICAAYNQLGEYEKAIEACNKALQYYPDYELAKGNLNVALSKKKQNERK